ncbi:MAG: sensor domain-containing diguanylate cyclase, partial [Spirochaetia bacterium]|nr:sensor domain-containing diguanylate cyclase [Spirochaetia bacterium]
GHCTFCNPACIAALGYRKSSDLLGKNMHALIHHSHANAQPYPVEECPIFRAFQKGVSCRISDEVFWRANGTSFPVEYSSHPQVVGGNTVGAVVVFMDITERKAAEEKIKHMAQYDTLTELPNRALFSDRLRQALAAAARNQTKVALMYIDLDKFKPINDQHGHDVGDLVLKEAALRMTRMARKSDTVARIGGDEFVIMLPDNTDKDRALIVAEKIRQALREPIFIQNLNLNISASIGIAVFPEHGSSELELSKHADQAMYRAKKTGRDRIESAD